jgi:hypothetical protein
VRCRARLHADQAGLEAGEQLQQLIAPNLTPKHGSAVIVDAMNLEDVLRDIQTDGANLHGDGSSAAGGPIDSTTLAHGDAVRSGAVHPIKLHAGEGASLHDTTIFARFAGAGCQGG